MCRRGQDVCNPANVREGVRCDARRLLASKAHTADDPAGDDSQVRSMKTAVRKFWQGSVRMCRQIIGVPDYDRYVAHLREHHPERAVPTYIEFFNERQQARYRGGGGRCC
jgi:uncharacterized short protein YbdD (DUF466 family)